MQIITKDEFKAQAINARIESGEPVDSAFLASVDADWSEQTKANAEVLAQQTETSNRACDDTALEVCTDLEKVAHDMLPGSTIHAVLVMDNDGTLKIRAKSSPKGRGPRFFSPAGPIAAPEDSDDPKNVRKEQKNRKK